MNLLSSLAVVGCVLASSDCPSHHLSAAAFGLVSVRSRRRPVAGAGRTAFGTALCIAAKPDGDDEVIDNEEEEEDWRSFRARLVMSQRRQDEEYESMADAVGGERSAKPLSRWTYDAGKNVEVGSVLLSVPTMDLCQGLHQQHFHKCVCLITHREGAGPVGTRGILLNRPTLSPSNVAEDEWWTWFGGEVSVPIPGFAVDVNNDPSDHERGEPDGRGPSGSEDDDDVVCLHSLRSTAASAASSTILPGLSMTTLRQARRLAASGDAVPSDFLCFHGHCAWAPGQLQGEMEEEGRDEWAVASLDASSLLEEVRTLQRDLDDADGSADDERVSTGVSMWKSIMGRIGRSSDGTSEATLNGRVSFYDRMLEAWSREATFSRAQERSNRDSTPTSLTPIKPGTVVRATLTSLVTSVPPYLLDEQEFHRSLILVLQDDEVSTVGVILNLPSSVRLEVGNDISFSLRHGGPLDLYDDEGDDGTYNPEESGNARIWIHRSPALRRAGIGTPLGDAGTSNTIWTMEESEALRALANPDLRGTFDPRSEVMALQGLCLWEKGEGLGVLGGGLQEQLDVLGTFEPVPNEMVDRAWEILTGQQEELDANSLEGIVKASIDAWDAVSAGSSSTTSNRDVKLADEALGNWLRVYLLSDEVEHTSVGL